MICVSSQRTSGLSTPHAGHAPCGEHPHEVALPVSPLNAGDAARVPQVHPSSKPSLGDAGDAASAVQRR